MERLDKDVERGHDNVVSLGEWGLPAVGGFTRSRRACPQ